MAYSQNNEEAAITGFFEGTKEGFFLDIGAYDGITFSNVRRLAELNWFGICFEPSPKIYPVLKKNMEQFEKVLCRQVAIGTENGKVDFYDSNGDAVSTTCTAHVEKWKSAVNFEAPVKVQMESIVEVLDDAIELYGQIDFLNIDIEGVNIELFRAITPEQFKHITMLCIEHDYNVDEIRASMLSKGFAEILYNGENLIFAKL
jgi:FkbM family methyltransferase